MDEDFEDLLGDEGLEDENMADNELLPTTRTTNKTSVPIQMPPRATVSTTIKDDNHAMSMPSENELRLGRRVLELEKERDALATELSIYKTRFPSHYTTIPIPIPDETTSSPFKIPIDIPSELLPLLSLLRRHVAELTRDNQALRYTFLGQPGFRRRSLTVNPGQRGVLSPRTPKGGTTLSPRPVPVTTTLGSESAVGVASSSKMTLDIPMTPSLSSESAAAAAVAVEYANTGLDLEGVVDRVKELVRENEELGEMILEAGKRDTDEWERALQESRAVITSLDSDLTHHATVVKSVREELDKYKTHFGLVPNPQRDSSSASTSAGAGGRTSSSASSHGISIRGMGGSLSSRHNMDKDSSGGGNVGQGLKRSGGSGRDTPSEPRVVVGARGGDQRQSASSQRQGDNTRGSGSGSRGSNTNGQGHGHGNDRTREFGGGGGRNDDRGSKRRR